MAGRDIKAGRAYVEISTKNGGLDKGLRAAQAKMKAFGDTVGAVGGNFLGLGAAVLAPLAAATKIFTSAGDELAKMRDRTGVSVEALSNLGYAAKQSGTDLKALETSFRIMARTIDDAGKGTGTAVEALHDLGLTAADLKGLNPEAQFRLMADRLSKIADPSQRAAAAMGAFGKSGTALLPMLSQGTAGLEALEKANRDAGRTMSTETAEAAVILGDTIADIGHQAKSAAVIVGAALAPTLKNAAEEITKLIQRGQAWAVANKETIVTILKVGAATAAAGVSLIVIGKAAGGVAAILGILAAAVKVTTASFVLFTAHPIGATLALIGAAAAGLAAYQLTAAKNTRELSAALTELRSKGDQARQVDALRIERLQQLAEKTRLSADESAEAGKLIGELSGKYGNFGATVNAVTNRIEGMAAGLAMLNEQMRSRAASELKQEIAALGLEIAKVDVKAREAAGFDVFGSNIPQAKTGAKLLEQRVELMQKLVDAQRRLAAVTSGDTKAALGEKPNQADTLSGKIAAGQVDAVEAGQRLIELRNAQADAETRLAAIQEAAARKRKTAIENEINDIIRSRDEQLKLLDAIEKGERSRAGGGRFDELQNIAQRRAKVEADAQAEKIAATQRAFDAAEQEQTRIAQDAAADRLAFEKSISDEMARVKIAAIKDVAEREKAAIEFERQKRLEEARAVGGNEGAVNRLFDAMLSAIAGADAAGASARASTSGTFNARVVNGLSGDSQFKPIVDQVKKTNTLLERQWRDLRAIGQLGGLA